MFVVSCGLALDTSAKLERGQQSLAEGEFRAAIIDAKSVLLNEPDNLEARLLLGRASVAVGDGAAAEKELLRAVELGAEIEKIAVDLGRSFNLQRKHAKTIADLDPDVLRDSDRQQAHYVWGEAFLGLGRPDAARQAFEAALGLDASDIQSKLGVVRSYVLERNLLQARQTLDHLLGENDSFGPALMLSGALSLQMEDPERATRDFSRAAELARTAQFRLAEMQALAGIGDALILTGEQRALRRVLGRMEEIGPDDSRTLLAAARIAIADEDWVAAQEDLQELLRRDASNRDAQMLLGIVHKQSGNLAQAEMYLTAVVAAQFDNEQARRLLAETRLALDKAEAAREALLPLMGDDNVDAAALSLAATASLGLGDSHEAIEYLTLAIASAPEDSSFKLQLALAYFQSGQYDQARLVLNSVPAPAPDEDDFPRSLLRVLTLHASGQVSDAIAIARTLQSRRPHDPHIYGLISSIEKSEGNLQAARSTIEAGLEIAPQDTLLLRSLAELDLLENDMVSARQRYLLMLDARPDDSEAMVALARLAALSEAPDEARDWLERARSADANSVLARSVLASHYLGQGQYDRAETVAQEAVRLQPENARLYNLLGLAKHFKRNYRDAVATLDQAVALDSNKPAYRYNLAQAQVAQGNSRKALSSLRNEVADPVSHLPSGLLEASILARSGKLDEARQLARRLRESYPAQSSVYALEAEIQVKTGDLRGAAQLYEEALETQMFARYAVRAYQLRREGGLGQQVAPLLAYLDERPLDTKMRMYLAQAYTDSHDLRSANEHYEVVLRQSPDDVTALNNLAWNYMMLGDARAVIYARRAVELMPDNVAVLDTLGWVLTRQGKPEEGIKYLARAVAIGNDIPDTKYRLAAALAESGRTGEAKVVLREALDSADPFANQQAARDLLATL